MIEVCLYVFPWLMEVYNHIWIFDHHLNDKEGFIIQLWICTTPIWNLPCGFAVTMHSVQHMPVLGIHDYASHNSQITLPWRHNGHDSVSYHQPHHCLLNRLCGCRSKKTSKLRVTGLCAGNSPGPVNFPHKWPVTRKMLPFDDVIMSYTITLLT